MVDWQGWLAITAFLGVMALVITEATHLMIAALLGALLLIFSNVLDLPEAVDYVSRGHQTLALFLGVMILVRSFEPTKVFDYIAIRVLILAQGSGKLILLSIVALTSVICSVLPNATTVLLLGPLLPPIAMKLGLEFVPLLILMVLTANSAGLLTLVGDPATFIVGDAINISFGDYLLRLGFAGVLAIATIVIMLPWLFPRTWRAQLSVDTNLELPTVQHPRAVVLGGLITAVMLVFFVIGESLPIPVSPAAIALLGATLALLISHHSKIETVNHILRDVDWSTLIFFMSIFVLVGGLEKTGIISHLGQLLAIGLGQNIALGALVLLFGIGFLSSVVPNIPLVVALVPLMKAYVVDINLAAPAILDPNYSGAFPPNILPLFYAMMLGATLGGNGTLVGASANIVGAGIAELHGQTISARKFLAFGMPVMLVQLLVAALFLTFRFLLPL